MLVRIMEVDRCKCGAVLETKEGNIAFFGGFLYGTYTYCPQWKWWQMWGHTEGKSEPIHI